MKLYHQYDPKTGKFLGSGKAQTDPIEKKYLTPKNATLESLPTHDRYQWPYWENGKWILKDSEFEISRKLNIKNENGVPVFKRVGDFAALRSDQEIIDLEQNRKNKLLKRQAEAAKKELLMSVYNELIMKSMSAKQLDYVKKLDAIINGEKLINIELPTLD